MNRLTSLDIARIVKSNQAAPVALQNPAIDELCEEIELMSLESRAEIARLRAKVRLLAMERDEWHDIACDALKGAPKKKAA